MVKKQLFISKNDKNRDKNYKFVQKSLTKS